MARTSRRKLHITVVSPHLDDAALSLGATIRARTLLGDSVTVLTVFANDPDAEGPPGSWDAACGFASAGVAARARRAEDRAACSELGANPVWLPFGDMEQPLRGRDDDVAEEVWGAAAGSDLVLLPGWPLAQPDHASLTELLLARRPAYAEVGFYVEQPYAALGLLSRGNRMWTGDITTRRSLLNAALLAIRHPGGCNPPALPAPGAAALGTGAWSTSRPTQAQRAAKWKAVRHYTSQVRQFGPLVVERIRLYEWGCGGEPVAHAPFSMWPSAGSAPSEG